MGRAPAPGEFIKVREWSVAERALELGRYEAWRYLTRLCPDLKIPKGADWFKTPAEVRRRDTPQGADWWFRFESPQGPWVELTVLVAGGIQDLDAGRTR